RSLVPPGSFEGADDPGGLEPLAPVGIHVAEGDPAISSQDEGPRNRELVRGVAIRLRQVDAEALLDRIETSRHLPHEPVAPGDLVAGVREYAELELSLLCRRQALVWRLRRDRDEVRAERLDSRKDLLVGAQLQVAIGAPLTAVEGDHDAALFQKRVERHLLAMGVRKRERRRCVPDTRRLCASAGAHDAVDLADQGPYDLGRRLLRELGVKCGDTITQEMIGDGSVGAGHGVAEPFRATIARMARRLLGSFDDPTVRFLTQSPARKILPARLVVLHVSSVSAVLPDQLCSDTVVQMRRAPRENAEWVRAIADDGADGEAARRDLREVLVTGLMRVLTARGADEDLCEDFAQEALLRVRERLGGFRGESRFTTWA